MNLDPKYTPVQQKRRKFGIERNQIINEEVNELLKAGVINEVDYSEWLANVIIVQKNNGKWRVCVDYTDLLSKRSISLTTHRHHGGFDCKT